MRPRRIVIGSAPFDAWAIAALCAVLLGTVCTMPRMAWAGSPESPAQTGPVRDPTIQWVPTQEEIRRYRESWNPLSNGPILLTAVDINPKGQFHSQYFVFGEVGHQMFGNTLTPSLRDSSFHLTAVEPLLTLGYGLTDHVELDAAFTGLYWHSTQTTADSNRTSASAVGWVIPLST